METNFGGRVREVCRSRGIRLKDLARHLGIRPSTLSQFLTRGKPSLERAKEIAWYLNVKLEELVNV